jgi:DNA-directed RNA polymerase subunit RPC12/RpoP
MKTCPSCQQTYTDDIESCPRDGSKLFAEFRDERECPYCGQKILKKARVCKHCGREVEQLATPDAPVKAPMPAPTRREPMRCPKCGLENPEGAIHCDCGYNFRTGLKESKPVGYTGTLTGGAPPRKMASDRYSDAYTVASAIISTGTAIKVIGVVFAVVGAVAVVWWYFREASPFFESFWVFGLFLCAAVGLGLWIAGVFITALGQMLRALLDTAVNTSPLIGNAEKERIMGITQRTTNV